MVYVVLMYSRTSWNCATKGIGVAGPRGTVPPRCPLADDTVETVEELSPVVLCRFHGHLPWCIMMADICGASILVSGCWYGFSVVLFPRCVVE